MAGSPPHTRGIPSDERFEDGGGRITPAYAGNTFTQGKEQEIAKDHPRIRGEYQKFSLHKLRHYWITPAYAGNSFIMGSLFPFKLDHPRIRGEYDSLLHNGSALFGSPPHTRGIPAFAIPPLQSLRITPAYAGNTCIFSIFQSAFRDHPRIRGEYQFGNLEVIKRSGSPPHTRGILQLPAHHQRRKRITPAYAGNTNDGYMDLVWYRDHPRIRGEYTKITAQLQHSHYITSHNLFSSK